MILGSDEISLAFRFLDDHIGSAGNKADLEDGEVSRTPNYVKSNRCEMFFLSCSTTEMLLGS